MYNSFEELIKKVKGKEPKRMAVSAAADLHTIQGALEAKAEGVVEPIFLGDAQKIADIIISICESPEDYTIVDIPDVGESCKGAVRLVREGKADFLMKGNVETSVLLKAVLDKENGLSTGSVMSHVALFEAPAYYKLMVIVDGGMIPYPTLEQKKAIIENTVISLKNMGYERPNVGVLACIEKVNPKMIETVEADALKQMYLNGEIKNCVVEGPISYDCAVSKDAAELKGYESPVSGEVDVFLVPNIHTGNIMAKTLMYTGGAKMAGFVAGASCPVVLTSRASTAQEKYLSIVVSAAACK